MAELRHFNSKTHAQNLHFFGQSGRRLKCALT